MLDAEVVVGSLVITPPVIVIKNEMLAFVAHDFSDALEISRVLGDDESTRIVRNYHSGGVDITALIVNRSGILSGSDGDVRRILPVAILRPVGSGNVNRIIGIIKTFLVIVSSGEREKVCQPVVYRGERSRVRAIDGINLRAARRRCRYAENVAGNFLRLIQDGAILSEKRLR